MLAIRTDDNRVSITRYDQVKAGEVYVIRGTSVMPEEDGAGGFVLRRKDMPPQLVVCHTPVIFRSVTDVGYCNVTLYVDMGSMGKVSFDTVLGMDQVNIPEMGVHDHHLERVPRGLAKAFGVLEEDNKSLDYKEMILG